ncbi:hypothetical protein KY290_032370 [Solanum tuberosum]|uniref:Uncharacterized protein n=1 Tax=Solanum tuberosum TaxID=4113 RepID=A0ABQ7UDP0_SOLTU|nr:hypothetical protein KY290_032370 [Solanum tuberosum]
MNRPILRRKEEKEECNPLGEIVQQTERKEGLNAVLGVNDHDSEQKASGNQESGGVENAEEEFHLDLAIIRSLLDSKISRQSKSTDKHIFCKKFISRPEVLQERYGGQDKFP